MTPAPSETSTVITFNNNNQYEPLLSSTSTTLCDANETSLKSKSEAEKLIRSMSNRSPDPILSAVSKPFFDCRHHPHRYLEGDVQKVADELRKLCPAWARVPRTFIVLSTVGRADLLDGLIARGFTDYCLPVSSRQAREYLDAKTAALFLRTQYVVMTDVVDVQDGGNRKHMHFEEEDSLLYETIAILGSGRFGQVHQVTSKLNNKEYVRKRISRNLFGRAKLLNIKSYTTELEILKRLDHHHIVKLVGSYTDSMSLALIMSPVADCNLFEFLANVRSSPHKKLLLRSFFGCLTASLAYLHKAQIRHKDIKPQNILVKGNTVLLADFGLSFDWSDSKRGTTEGATAMTPRYSAPEVVDYEPRNSSSDIWSLGCVFLDIITVLKGETVKAMRRFFEFHGSYGQYFYNNLEAKEEWVSVLREMEPMFDNTPLDWVSNMLKHDRYARLEANYLLETIRNASSICPAVRFCGTCCIEKGKFD
ncbi:kinase-like protein [Cenococcum geophilum 1.58]|uniref:kinase-like protein n=1 Tax=Cenococcum geophilum 1.58 TaxID=794803 RepID=UPI00358DE005|nr:kinase-like protein [Cenococcum geophilum 1.58]